MDRLRGDETQGPRKPTLEEKAEQALEMADTAIWLKQTGLRARYPDESDAQIEQRLRDWLSSDE